MTFLKQLCKLEDDSIISSKNKRKKLLTGPLSGLTLKNEDKTFQKIKTKTICFLESFTKGVYSRKEGNNAERKACNT